MAVGTLTIDCSLAGNGLVKSGDGTLALGGADSYSDCMTIDAGVVLLQNAAALPAQTWLTINGGALDLGGETTAALTTVTLAGGNIEDGTLVADTSLELYSGNVLANLTGSAELDKLGPAMIVLAGENSYQGGTNALDGTLVAAYQDSLPSAASGTGTVIVQPTLYWSGSGDWTAGQWQLADGTPTPWIDGSSVVIASGSDITISGVVNVSAVTFEGDATITGGTLSLPALGRHDQRARGDRDGRFYAQRRRQWQRPGGERPGNARAGRHAGLFRHDDRLGRHARPDVAPGRGPGSNQRAGDRPWRAVQQQRPVALRPRPSHVQSRAKPLARRSIGRT